jgi:S-adenosylmethionine:tRNA ribosyltransferase-isomerase
VTADRLLHPPQDCISQRSFWHRSKTKALGVEYVTLHVHLGTFAPLEEDQWEKKELHMESYHIAPDTMERLNAAKKEGRPIIAVGTTTVRTLESATIDSTTAAEDRDLPLLRSLHGDTSIFITEETPLHFVDHLITNFHLPSTSLLMLVAAFTGREKLLELYQKAIAEKMRFYSFGDGMLVL